MESTFDQESQALLTDLGTCLERIVIIPLYGQVNEFHRFEDASSFLETYSIHEGSGSFRKYEVQVSFSNGDLVNGSFKSKQEAQEFLQLLASQ